MVHGLERKASDLESIKAQRLHDYTRRIGHHQLIQLTRGMENGKAPVQLEPSPLPGWVPVPPHLSSHWKSIAGQHADPPRESAIQLRATGGRRSFPEKQHLPVADASKVVWGGAHPQD